MPEERNALAELAEELERFSAENKGLFARRNHLILHKAQRIIAELAKLKVSSQLIGKLPTFHTIAEEGANE